MKKGLERQGKFFLSKREYPSYSLNSEPFLYYGLKLPANKGRFAILILNVWVIRFKAKITPASLYLQGFQRLMTKNGAEFRYYVVPHSPLIRHEFRI